MGRKKFSKDESKTLIEAHLYHKGNWNKIIEDEKVKALNKNKNQL